MSIIRLNFTDDKKIILRRTVFKFIYWLFFKTQKNKIWSLKLKTNSQNYYCLAKIKNVSRHIIEMDVIYE